MNTSNFRKHGTHPNAVSIAGKSPDWYTGKEYKILAPKYWFFKKYKEDGDEMFYMARYYEEVLNDLVPIEVWEALGGSDAILLCWEEPGKFCHRNIVAKWLNINLGAGVEEI